jgi:hypothetical protein
MKTKSVKQAIVLALTIFMLVGCSRPRIQTEEIGLIDISKSLVEGEMVLLSSVAESIKYIELQSDSNCLLGTIEIPIEDIVVHDNRIYIADQSKVLAFDMSGKFLTQIGSQGRGPGEYMYPDDIAVLQESEMIAVFSEPSKKVYLYTLDGVFQKDIDINFLPTRMISFMNMLIFVSPPGRRHLTDYFTLTIIDEDGEIKNRLLVRENEKEIDEKNEIALRSSAGQVYLMDSSLYYYEKYYDTIWRVSSDFIVDSKTHFSFGNDRHSIDDVIVMNPNNKNASTSQILSDAMSFVIPQWYIDSPNYTFFRIMNKGKLNHIIYNKTTKDSKSLLYESGSGLHFSLFNDIDGGLPFWPDGIFNDEGVLKLIQGVKLKQHISENQDFFLKLPAEKRVNIQNIISRTDVNDNPILMVVQLK